MNHSENILNLLVAVDILLVVVVILFLVFVIIKNNEETWKLLFKVEAVMTCISMGLFVMAAVLFSGSCSMFSSSCSMSCSNVEHSVKYMGDSVTYILLALVQMLTSIILLVFLGISKIIYKYKLAKSKRKLEQNNGQYINNKNL